MTPELGVDPGKTSGAAVLLAPDGREVLTWCAWWTRRAGGWHFVTPGDRTKVDHWARGLRTWRDEQAAARALVWGLTVEGLEAYRGKRSASPRDLLVLGEACGEAIGLLRVEAEGLLLRPKAGEWRAGVLGLKPRTRAEKAEAYAVSLAPARVDWHGVGGWPSGLPKVPRGAIAEAACMARWGWSVRRRERMLRGEG